MVIAEWLELFSKALGQRDASRVAALFGETSYWRDFLAFTWDLRTIEGRADIERMLSEQLPLIGDSSWALDPATDPFATEGFIIIETRAGRGRGYLRLAGDTCLTLLTTLEELKGHEQPRGDRRSMGFVGGPQGNWRDSLEAERRELGIVHQPYVLIVGGGQGGLGLAARLRQLGVPSIVVDRHERSGDQWRRRYASLSLHDPVWYDHMPYLPFPDTWPVYTPKDKLAEWLESYEQLMELNVWHATECLSAAYDPHAGAWQVSLCRNGEPIELRPTHLVLAAGNAGKAITPDFPGMENFQGIQCHSSEHPGGNGLGGKAVVVIGSNNSAHDICADLVDHDADVTMVQRSSTHIARQDTLIELGLAGLYSEQALAAGITTERADLLAASLPLRMLPLVQQPIIAEMKRRDADFYRALEDVGFLLDFGEDDTGIAGKYLRRAAGYYIDVGASAMIANGTIGLRAGVDVARIVPDGVMLSDGSHLNADVIIYATGFSSMDQWVADLISPEVAQRVGKVWGYGSATTNDPGPWEGELRNMWKPTAQPGLWFHGGNLAQSRFYSTFLALQLKARFEALPTPIYRPKSR